LEALSQSPNYYGWLLRHFVPYLGKRVLEVGAGIGTVADYLLRNTSATELVLIEPADNLFPRLKERFGEDSRVKLVHGRLDDVASSISVNSVIAINVLEHVADDTDLLRMIHRVLLPGGTVLLFVPALPWLYGTLDESFQHVRRYTKRRFAAQLETAGFHLERLHYFNCPGVIAWFVAGKILRRKTIRVSQARGYDRWVVPLASRLETYWTPPFGQSLVAVARK
jgi:SAM-dependent methyltransferase